MASSNANAVSALREDDALRRLRTQLGVPTGVTTCNSYLLQFLRAAHLGVDGAVRKLESRREFEAMMLTIFSSAHTIESLQSGAFSVLGEDVFRRPVFYVRIRNYRHSGDSTSETRLAVLVLELLQTLVEIHHVDQCLVLVNEEEAGFWAGRDSPMQERLAALVQKHYPGLIHAILVVNSSWGTKRILRLHAAANGVTEMHQLVQFVSAKELSSLMAPSVIPREFGGTNNVSTTCPPDEFADRVLRHWYALSSLLHADAELPAGQRRALWNPIPRHQLYEAATISGGIVQRRQQQAAEVGPHRGAGAKAGAAGSTGPNRGMMTARGGPNTPRGAARAGAYAAAGGSDVMSDDGRCSAITDSDLITAHDEWSAAEADGSPSVPKREDSIDLDGAADLDPSELRDRLRLEQQRRRQLEATVDDLRLGTAYRDGGASEKPIEAALREHHTHVNALVAQIVTQHKNARPAPSLKTLLAATDDAILGAIPAQQQTPCMSGAHSVDRKPRSSCVIC